MSGFTGTLLFSNPPLNVLDEARLDALTGELTRLTARREVRLVALRSAGRDFCAGTDVGGHRPGKIGRLLGAFHGLVRALLTSQIPTVALVQGRALGGGAELALACDFVLAETTASFGWPEIRLGAFPPVAAVLLPRRVGHARAAELVLSGEPIPARQAARLGLVNSVVPSGRLDMALEKLAKKLSAHSAAALRLARRALGLGGMADALAALEAAELLYLRELAATRDAREGVEAFLARRPPVWRDR